MSPCTITCPVLSEVSFPARTDGCGCAWPPCSGRMCPASSVLPALPCWSRGGSGISLWLSPYTPAAFRNIRGRGLELLVPL